MAKRGRPPIFKTPEEFNAAVDRYVAACKRAKEPLTMSGMAYALGYACRQDIDDTAKRDGFSLPVKRAKLLIESSYEKSLRGKCNAAGPIFALKNFGWKDKQDVDLTATITPASLFAAAPQEGGK